MLREEHDLADVIGEMRHRAVERLDDRVTFTTDVDVFRQILGS